MISRCRELESSRGNESRDATWPLRRARALFGIRTSHGRWFSTWSNESRMSWDWEGIRHMLLSLHWNYDTFGPKITCTVRCRAEETGSSTLPLDPPRFDLCAVPHRSIRSSGCIARNDKKAKEKAKKGILLASTSYGGGYPSEATSWNRFETVLTNVITSLPELPFTR